jgi:iron donor protein CyaY
MKSSQEKGRIMTAGFSETDFRAQVQKTLDRVEKAFDAVDPDTAECTQQFGALTIQLATGARCILSSQPSVRQLWLALAARGMAHHFNWDPERQQWLDDKGQGIEVLELLQKVLQEDARLDVRF